MKIIFLKGVPSVGKKYEIKEVANGFGRHLISTGAVEAATPEAVARIEKKMLADASQKKIHTDLLMKNLGDLSGVSITLRGKTNEKGHLFAAIHKDAILAELKVATHLDMHPDYVLLEKPLKAVGAYEIPVIIDDKKVSFTVVVEEEK